jgi:hypothetical protein
LCDAAIRGAAVPVGEQAKKKLPAVVFFLTAKFRRCPLIAHLELSGNAGARLRSKASLFRDSSSAPRFHKKFLLQKT